MTPREINLQLASCWVGDFLVANATGTNRPAEEAGLSLLFQRRFG